MTDQSMGDAPRAVRISTDGVMATVTVDGTDLSKAVNGYQIDHRPNQLPFVILFTRPNADGDLFDGMAEVAVATQAPPGDAIAAFLKGIDPAALEASALERDDLDGSRHELTVAMLTQLAEWAKGKV